jgi:hypothetical protein
VKIGVVNLEGLKLGIKRGDSELLAQEEGLLLLGQRFINGRGDLRADFSYGSCIVKAVVTCWRRKDDDSVEGRNRN